MYIYSRELSSVRMFLNQKMPNGPRYPMFWLPVVGLLLDTLEGLHTKIMSRTNVVESVRR